MKNCLFGPEDQKPSRLLAQPPWLGFQAVIKSAASAASLGPRKNPKTSRKNREKMNEKLPFWAFDIGIPIACMHKTRQNQ